MLFASLPVACALLEQLQALSESPILFSQKLRQLLLFFPEIGVGNVSETSSINITGAQFSVDWQFWPHSMHGMETLAHRHNSCQKHCTFVPPNLVSSAGGSLLHVPQVPSHGHRSDHRTPWMGSANPSAYFLFI